MQQEFITVTFNRTKIAIRCADILYVIMSDDHCTIHMFDGSVYRCRMTLKELKKQLDEGFMEVKRGCMIAVSAISDIGDKIFERYPWIEFNSYLKQLYIIYGGIGILQEMTKEIQDQIYEIELYRVEKYGTRADKLIVSPEDLLVQYADISLFLIRKHEIEKRPLQIAKLLGILFEEIMDNPKLISTEWIEQRQVMLRTAFLQFKYAAGYKRGA